MDAGAAGHEGMLARKYIEPGPFYFGDVRRAADNVSGDRTKYNEAIREMLRDAKERLRDENGRLRLRKR